MVWKQKGEFSATTAIAIAFGLWFSSVTPAKTVLTKQASSADENSAFLGEVEFRPSFAPTDNRFFSFNYAEAGFRPSKNIALSYQQAFVAGTSDYDDPAAVKGSQFHLFDGVLKAQLNDLWVDPKTDLSFSDEPRVVLPTDPGKSAKGMVVDVHNYLKLKKAISPDFSFTLKEDPIAHFYSADQAIKRSPDGTSPNKLVANPMFENMVWLVFDFAPKDSIVSFSLPLVLDSTRFRDADPAADNSGGWSHYLFVYPELTFKLEKHVFMGAAYESGNLVNLQDDGLDDPAHPNPSVGGGTWHMFLRASF